MPAKTEKANPSEKILLTAFECLSTKGYANVTMRNIADEAGVALSQLTYYYKNKENLFMEVINMMTEQYLNEMETTLAAAADPAEKILSFASFFRKLITDKPNLLRLFIDFTAQALWIPSFRERLNNLFTASTKIIEKNLPADAVDSGSTSENTPEYLSRLLFGALFGTSIQIILNSDQESVLGSLYLTESLLS